MAALWAALTTGDVEELLNARVSRRALWTGAAIVGAVSGATYAVLTWKPSAGPAVVGASPVEPAAMKKLLSDIAVRVERSQKVTAAARRLAMVSSKDKPAVEAAAAEHTRAVLRDAEKAALAAADVTKEQATDAWRYFTSAYEMMLDEEAEGDEDVSEAELAELRGVVGAGWRIKRATAPLMMDKGMILDVAACLGRACERAVPDAFLQLQEELDDAGVASMPPAQRQQAVVGRVQAVQPAIMARGEARMKEEFGVSRPELTALLTGMQATDPSIGEAAGAALKGFQTAMGREMKALVASLGMG